MAAGRLEDPACTTGRAAALLGVQQAFQRALDAAGGVRPQQSASNHRRYTRRQLAMALPIRELFDQGYNLASALRILPLEDDLAAERELTACLHRQLSRSGPQRNDAQPGGGPGSQQEG